MKNNFYNSSGYADPTAYEAMKPVEKIEKRIDKKANNLIGVIKTVCDLSGFEIVGRVQIKDKRSGKEFK